MGDQTKKTFALLKINNQNYIFRTLKSYFPHSTYQSRNRIRT